MRILQFHAADDAAALVIEQQIVDKFNEWFGFPFSDPDYVTQPYTPDIFKKGAQDLTLYWVDYDLIYETFSDDGKANADAQLTGLITTLGLQLLDVPNLADGGYVVADTLFKDGALINGGLRDSSKLGAY